MNKEVLFANTLEQVRNLAKEQGKQLNLQIAWDMNFKTDKHYFLLSVFHIRGRTLHHLQFLFRNAYST